MAVIKKYSPFQNIGSYDVFIDDGDIDSPYFNITELERTLTGGKNAFLFEGSPYLKKGSNVRFEALDVEGNTLYIEPGVQAGKTFKDGTSIVMAIHIYDDTPIGIGSLQITAELETYIDEAGREIQIPEEFRDRPNVRWTQTFKVNPKIPNSTQVRFFKRPTFTVTEIEKQLLIKTNMSLSKSGSIIGIPEIPDTGSDFSTWTAPSQYRIKLQEGNKFTQSMDENTTLVVSDLGYSSSVLEVLNEDEMLVRKPYLKDNIVNEFTPVSYSMDFESVEDATVNTGSNVIASYAEIRLENLKTFTGDVARIKIFRKSRNDLGDFQVVQENKLDATELLRDFSVPNRTVINYGKLRRENIVSEAGDVYYTTSSGVLIHNKHLINALDIGANQSIESAGTIGEFEIVSGSEYSFSYVTRYSGSGATSDSDSLRFLLVTSSNNTGTPIYTSQSIDLVTGSTELNPSGISNHNRVVKNFFAEINGKCQIRVEADTDTSTGRFLFSKLSLKNAEESSYSPDEYTAVVDIPRKNPTEQFDFRVEFYDINNNFIPIKVEQSVPFTKGNQSRILETAVNVSASGVADAGDILSVAGGVVQIASTNIQSSTIAGLGDPTNFSAELQTATASLVSKTDNLQIATQSLQIQTTNLNQATQSLASSTDSLNQFTSSFNTAIALNSDDVTIKGDLTVQGTSTALDTNTLNVKDLNILVASGAADSNAADGAGLTIDGADRTLTWNHGNSRFQFNDSVHTDGILSATDVTSTNLTASVAQIGTSGTSNLYLGNTIDPSSADKGARFHSDNNDFFLDFQGDATQNWFLRDYDGVGGIHDRFTFDFINGHISSSGGLYSANIINSAGNVMIGGNLSVTGSIGNTSEGPLGNHPGRVKISSSLQGHTQYSTGVTHDSPVGGTPGNNQVYSIDLRTGNFFYIQLLDSPDCRLQITSSNEGQISYLLVEQNEVGIGQFSSFGDNIHMAQSGSALQPTTEVQAKDIYKIITFNSGSTPFIAYLSKETTDAIPGLT